MDLNSFLKLTAGALILLIFLLFVLKVLFRSKKSPQDEKSFYDMQLETIHTNEAFRRKRLLNDSEYVAYHALCREIDKSHLQGSVFLFPQVALGEVLRHQSRYCYSAINSKRVDFLLVNKGFWPLAAIEVQGTGHSLGTTSEQRDTVKKDALESAGVAYIPLDLSSTDPAHINAVVEQIMGQELPRIAATKTERLKKAQ